MAGKFLSATRRFGLAVVLSVLGVCLSVAYSQRPLEQELARSSNTFFVVSVQAQAAGSSYPPAPPDEHRWTPVNLPDNWDGRRAGFEGYVWYRIPIPLQATSWRRPAVYLPVAGMNAELWLNGRRVAGAGRMTAPVSRHFYTPQLLELLPDSLRGSAGSGSELWVLVVGYAGYRSGLAPVWLGEYDDLFGAWRTRRFWQIEGNAATIVVNVSMAVFVLLIGWRNRPQSAYLWFGASTLVWALRNLNYWVTHPVIPDLLFAKLCVSGSAWFVALFAIFAMRFCESHLPNYQGPRWLQAFALAYACVATLHFLSASDYAAANRGFALLSMIGIGLTLWSMARLVRLAWARPTEHLVAVAAGAVTYLALLLNDFAIGINQTSLGEVFMRQYAVLPLFIAVVATLAKQYGDALTRSRELAASLQTQVEAQRLQLQKNFDQLREAEREQARQQERSRVMGDLHDGLGMHLAAALRQVRRIEVPRDLLASALQDCLDELRVAVDSLDEQERDPVSLLGSLRFRLAPRFESLGIALVWMVADDLPELPVLDPSQALHLLRVVQELLGNALKHSQATVVTLSIDRNGNRTVVTVADNGCGFDPHRVAKGRGLGHLQSRANQLHAQLNWLTGHPGSSVQLELPEPVPAGGRIGMR